VIGVLNSEMLTNVENRFIYFYIFRDASDYQLKVILIEIYQIESVPSLPLPIEIERTNLPERFRRMCHN
jgi:hypothetical protein